MAIVQGLGKVSNAPTIYKDPARTRYDCTYALHCRVPPSLSPSLPLSLSLSLPWSIDSSVGRITLLDPEGREFDLGLGHN